MEEDLDDRPRGDFVGRVVAGAAPPQAYEVIAWPVLANQVQFAWSVERYTLKLVAGIGPPAELSVQERLTWVALVAVAVRLEGAGGRASVVALATLDGAAKPSTLKAAIL